MERTSASLIKLSEEFHELQSVRMNVCSQQVDRQVHGMSDNKNNDEEDFSDHIIGEHASHLIDH